MFAPRDQVDNFIHKDEIQEDLIEVSVADASSPNKKKAIYDNKKATNQHTHHTLLKTMEVLENIEKRRMEQKKEKSEFVLFGESVGEQLEALPEQDAISLQLQIQTMISKARLDHLENIVNDI